MSWPREMDPDKLKILLTGRRAKQRNVRAALQHAQGDVGGLHGGRSAHHEPAGDAHPRQEDVPQGVFGRPPGQAKQAMDMRRWPN